MSLFEKLFKRGERTQGIAPLPEEMMGTMQPGIAGPQFGMDAPMPDPTMLANQPILQNFREQEEMAGLSRVTLDNDSAIDDFASKLRGFRVRYDIDMQTGLPQKRVERFGKPFCNESGVNELIGDLRMYMNKAIMLSNIPKSERDMIDKWCLVVAIDTMEKIAMNTEAWSVDRSKRSTILDLFMGAIWFNMMRAYEDGERRKLYPGEKNINMNSTLPHMMPPQKRSVLEI